MRYKKSLFFTAALVMLSIFAYQKLSFDLSQAEAQSAQKIIRSESQIREEMIIISENLGVTCTECHNVQNFKDGSKKNHKVSLEHMKITALLREQGWNGKSGPDATCYMCHRGQLRPPIKAAH